MEPSLKTKLDRNIWITRKCRINASERLLSHAKYIEILNVYYSIFVIILSLISLTKQDNLLSMISLSCSIALTISIIYANVAGYRERSSSLKQNYIELQLLLDQLSCIDDNDTDSVVNISVKYAELLKSSENHIPIDMYQLKVSNTDPGLALSKEEKRSYYCQLAWRYLWRGALILLPLAAAILYFVLR
ncbi:SLATT domain-containing protein [uncultured Dysosmobacter sp.]|uniref:SLATT domain-containing protein n=1 Tax=uncultured Dysosmobacter sp. TaxID=2591384 RepID=UPI00262BFB1C|nr:SLATT domain-containing protein [uncultured Dysosmobacter sp.]